MRSNAEIDRDHEGMGEACVRRSHGCAYPDCTCDRSRRIVPNVRGIGGPKLKTDKRKPQTVGQAMFAAMRDGVSASDSKTQATKGPEHG